MIVAGKPVTRWTLIVRAQDDAAPAVREERFHLTADTRASAEREAREVLTRRLKAGERIIAYRLAERAAVTWHGGETK